MSFTMRRFCRTLVIAQCWGLAVSALTAEAGTKSLPGHVLAVTSQLTPVGDLDPSKMLNLAIGLNMGDSRGLDNFLSQLYTPGSPNYQQYLTPQQFTARFGPSVNDLSNVVAFAAGHHLSVTRAHDNRMLVDVTGSVADIEKAFGIHLRVYHHPTEARDFYAPDSDPTVDASLPIADVSGLNNYGRPHPHLHPDTRVGVPRSGSASDGGYMGGDFRAAYLPDVSLTGTGQIVGLAEFDGFYASDITSYQSQASLPAVPVQTVLIDGFNGTPTTGSDSGNPEVSLDIEMAMSMAPGLTKVVSFEGNPNNFIPNDVLNTMAASNQIKQLSSSWGWTGGPNTTTDNIFKQMQAEGQSYFNAAGDGDAFTVGSSSINGVDNSKLENAPSSSPYITQVGGTTLTTTGPLGSWSSETVWNWGNDKGTSGGVSSYYSIPSWQSGVSMSANSGSTTYRNIPDVALTGDNIYVVYGDGSSSIFGGTSCAAPLWAAVTALINQQRIDNGMTNIGFVNPAIYALGQSSSYSSSFHDITTGNNTSTNSPNNYYAVAGYDLCTGWGTPSGQALINALAGPPLVLELTPQTGFSAVGAVGGPFSVTNETFVLTNVTGSTISWGAQYSANWLSVTPSSGSLEPDSATTINVTLSTQAAAEAIGSYSGQVIFTNLNGPGSASATFSLTVNSPYQSIVLNGGFETGTFTDWTLVGDTTVISHHQTAVYNAVEPASFSGGNVVYQGSYGAALGDDKVATLSQTLPTVAGQTYLLSFWLENLGAGSSTEPETFSVQWNGATLAGALTNPSAFAWTNFQYVVQGSGSSTVLQFNAENYGSYFGLDSISVLPVPTLSFQSAVASAGNVSVTWNTAPGLTYQVQYTSSLTQPNWINLGAPVLATNLSLSMVDTGASQNVPQRFYRLMLVP